VREVFRTLSKDLRVVRKGKKANIKVKPTDEAGNEE
jgi:hypothetical protein